MPYRRSTVDMEPRWGYRATDKDRATEKVIHGVCASKPVRRVTTDWILSGNPSRYNIRGMNKTTVNGRPTALQSLMDYLAEHGPQLRTGLHLKIGCSSHAVSGAIKYSSEIVVDRISGRSESVVRLRNCHGYDLEKLLSESTARP